MKSEFFLYYIYIYIYYLLYLYLLYLYLYLLYLYLYLYLLYFYLSILFSGLTGLLPYNKGITILLRVHWQYACEWEGSEKDMTSYWLE
jgi:hypothetical protein